MRGGEEDSLELLRDRTRAVGADGAVVDLADRDDLGGRPRVEGLVGRVEVQAREVAFLDADVADVTK